MITIQADHHDDGGVYELKKKLSLKKFNEAMEILREGRWELFVVFSLHF